MSLREVIHLVDDTTAGGVMRVLDHIATAPGLSTGARHRVKVIDPRRLHARRLQEDVIVSHLSVNWRNMPMLIALRAANPGKPLVHVEHSYTEGFVALHVTHPRRFNTLLRIAYTLFDRVVAVSQAQGRWLEDRGHVRKDALRVIQSCVDLSAFRNMTEKRQAVPVLGAIGRLDTQKGFDTLIAAVRQSPANIRLHIYGEGVEMQALQSLAAGDPRISFMGFVSDPAQAMAAVDAVAMPSRWEAYGLVAIEALSAGRTLLVNQVDGLADHAAYGAHVVSSSSVSAWSRAIDQWAAATLPRPVESDRRCDGFEQRFADRWNELLTSL